MKKLFFILIMSAFMSNVHSQSIIESNNRFCFDIYQKIKQNENYIFSPASITSAMAMTYSGAKNNTFKEIGDVFYFNKDINEFNKDFSKLTEFNLIERSNLQFSNANSIWFEESLELNKQFLEVNKQFYSGSAYQENFITEPEKARNNINSWVEDKTNNKIKNLLKPSAITNETRLVLVNALYFKGPWDKQFNEKNNTIDDFQIRPEVFNKVTFMNTTLSTWYYEDKYAQIVDIPYSDSKFSLMIIMPKSFFKLRRFENKIFNYEYYMNYNANKVRKGVKLSIPKFDIESDFDLNETLIKMGVKDAFSGSADFSGITSKEQLVISNVIHKAKIIVNEEGTEAAAATAVIMRKTSMLLDEVKFKVNKPFIYILRNNENNCIYFFGKVVSPNK